MTTRYDFKDKRLLVTGAAGTVGRELLRQLNSSSASELVGFDNNEAGLFDLSSSRECDFTPVLGDIRDRCALNKAMHHIDVVIHLAALKHVGFSESKPMEAVKTNILAVNNLIDAALANNVEYVINTSTDKAVNPFSVMGTSKLMGEQLIRAADLVSDSTVFSSTRFGNVLGSSGSVVPLFRQQLESGKPLTLTSKKMTRFVMTLEDAARLVLESINISRGGEIFITKMKTIRIEDLANAMIQIILKTEDKSTISEKIVEVGARPGEKFYEELMSSEEMRRCEELEEYFVIYPAMTDVYKKRKGSDSSSEKPDAYNSQNQIPMSKDDLIAYLLEKKIL